MNLIEKLLCEIKRLLDDEIRRLEALKIESEYEAADEGEKQIIDLSRDFFQV